MNISFGLSGSLEHAEADAEAAIHKFVEELGELLKRFNVTHSGSLSTPTLGGKTIVFTATAPAPLPTAPAAESPAAPAEQPASPSDAPAQAEPAPAAETANEEPAAAEPEAKT